MLVRSETGTWLPAWVPQSSFWLSFLLIICCIVQAATGGYDSSMLNGLNILPSYTDYFHLNAATTGLNTASIYIGGFLGCFVAGPMTDRLGRRMAIFWSAVITVVGIIIQTAAQDIAMFVIGRIILGVGSVISAVSSAVYLSETFPSQHRAWGMGILNAFWYVGALIAAGITLGTGTWESTWAWRAPSLIQSFFAALCILILPFIPESPRWLVDQGLFEAARVSVAQTNTDGDIHDPIALAIYKEIADTLKWEKEESKVMTPLEIAKDPVARKRMLIGMSAGPFSSVCGNLIATYYFGAELESAGVTESIDQLKANVVLNVWCLFCSMLGTWLCARWGRKSTALVGQTMLTVCLFIIGGLSKKYADNPKTAPQSLVYGDVAVMYIFQGFFSIAWQPLLFLYPTEVMNYSIRATGMAFSSLNVMALALILVFTMPIGLENIGWKMYFINGGWDIIIIVLIAIYWVETKDKTLEEIDALFEIEGKKHSDVPDVELLRQGKEMLNVSAVEKQLAQQGRRERSGEEREVVYEKGE